MKKYIFEVDKSIKVLKFLQNKLPNYKYSDLEKALRKKDIIVDDKRIKENIILVPKQNVCVFLATSTKQDFVIYYEDENVLVINKGKGIEVCDGEYNLVSELSKLNYKVYPIHRLDRNTTGLVVFAKSNQVEKLLIRAFKEHRVEKYYYALVFNNNNILQTDKLVSYLKKDSKNSFVKIYDNMVEGSEKIETEYELLNKNERTALLQVKITAGKTHQIRAHLKHFNMAIVGDGKYGDNKQNSLFKAKTQYLQAYYIKFNLEQGNKLFYLNNIDFCIEKQFDIM